MVVIYFIISLSISGFIYQTQQNSTSPKAKLYFTMKIVSQDEMHNYTSAIQTGGLKGAGVGLGISTGFAFWLRKNPVFLRTVTPTVRTFFFLAPVLACGVTATEWASLRFDQQQHDFGEADKVKIQAQQRVEALPILTRWKLQASQHKYKIVVGAWAASLGGSFWYINRDKFLSRSQKLVQARMYAQALTVAILLGSMLLSVNSRDSFKVSEDDEYSWQSIAAEEETRERAAGIPLYLEHAPTKSSSH